MTGVTVKLTEAEFSLPFDAVTVWGPAGAAGTVNGQALKLPIASVVHSVATLLPSKVTARVLYGAKPLPLIAAPLPTGLALGVRLMAELTAKVALPESVPSDAVTVCGPAGAVGTVNAQLLLAGRLPLSSAVQVPDVLSGVPSNVTVRLLLALTLLPLSVTALPTTPAAGFRLMTGVAVKRAAAAFALVSDAVTVWGPAGAAGTVNGQALKLPLALVVQDVATLLLSKLTVMVAFALKPLPLTAAVLPTTPALGARLMAGVTVYIAEAAFALVSDAVTVWGPAGAAGTVNAQ
jgi:hypothetical protein